MMESAVRAALIAVAWFAAMFSPAAAEDSVGFSQFTSAPGDGRQLDIAVWYPAKSGGEAKRIGDNKVFVGKSVHPDAAPAPGVHSLIVLSHGFGGNLFNQSWLAVDLARRGYVVAAVNHPGTTSSNMDKTVGARLWERPRDISHAIDMLVRDPAWSDTVSKESVAVIGHSLGGWTAMELAGARFDANRFTADCQENRKLAACEVYRQIGAGTDAEARAALGQDLSDPRVKAVVSLDLGLARGFDPESLSRVGVPVLVLAADGGDARIPAELESRHLTDLLPPATTGYAEIPGAAHFSFMSLCKPGAVEALEQDVPGDGIVCRDAKGGERAAIHEQVTKEIASFLNDSLAPK